METIFINIKGFSNRVHYTVLNIYNKNELKQKGTHSIILERPKGKSLGYINTYRRYRQYKRVN